MKLAFLFKILCLVLILLLFTKCPVIDIFYDIDIINLSDHSISAYFAFPYEDIYSDTTLPIRNPFDKYSLNKDIKSGKKYCETSQIRWEVIINELPDSTLHVFIFHTDTLNKYTWDEVRAGYKILKRYDLTIDDLHKMNFKINYTE